MQRIDRTRRVGGLIKRALPAIIREHCCDWDLGILSITATEVTKDLKQAIVFFTLLGAKENQERATTMLNNDGYIFRKELSSNLNLRHTPTIEFRYDASIERGVRLTRLIDGLALTNNGSAMADE